MLIPNIFCPGLSETFHFFYMELICFIMFVDEVKLATGKMTVIINIPTPTYKISPPPSSTTPTKKNTSESCIWMVNGYNYIESNTSTSMSL